jgi:hypothetical protein
VLFKALIRAHLAKSVKQRIAISPMTSERPLLESEQIWGQSVPEADVLQVKVYFEDEI